MNKVILLFIFCSIVFNMKLLSFGNLSIYLNTLLQGGLVFFTFLLLFIFLRKNKGILSVEFSKIDFLILIYFFYLMVSIRPELNSIAVFISFFLFILIYYLFRFYNKFLNSIQLLIIFSLAIAVKDVVYLTSYDISNIAYYNRIKVDAMGNFNNFSYINVLAFATNLYLLQQESLLKKFTKVLIYISMMIQLLMIVILYSRGGWVALALTIITFIIFNKSKMHPIKRFFRLTIISLIIFILFILLDKQFNIMAQLTMRLYSIGDGTGSGRSWIWETILIHINYYFGPLELFIGKGHGSFEMYIHGKYYNSAHNFFIESLYETGIIGSLFFILLLASLFIKAIKSRKSDKSASAFYMCIILVFTLSNFFDSHIYIVQTNWIFALLISLIVSGIKIPKKKHADNHLNKIIH